MQKSEREHAIAKAAFALMSQHGVVPTPANYELFYTYAAAENPAVARQIDERIAQGEAFTPEFLEQLHKSINTTARTRDAMEAIEQSISTTLNATMHSLESAGRDALAYGRTLSEVSGELGDERSPDDLRKLMDELTGATRAMEQRTKQLEAELQQSSDEVADLKSKLDDVRRESLTDPLTGISNRKRFDDDLANAIASSSMTGEPFALFMCDIDHFKSFNDTWGHQTGDQVLRLIATCLSENVKGRDTAARYGGEEFCVILRQTTLDHALNLAEQIRTNVQSKKLVKKSTGDILGTITISIGVAQFAPNETAETLIKRADACLYAAKHSGRNRVIGETELRPDTNIIAAA